MTKPILLDVKGKPVNDDTAAADLPERPTTQKLRKEIVSLLVRNFPGASFLYDENEQPVRLAWIIDILDHEKGGVIQLRNLWIGSEFGVIVKMESDTHDEILRKVVYYAAELFERYRIKREQAYDMREELLGIPRDFRGAAIHQ